MSDHRFHGFIQSLTARALIALALFALAAGAHGGSAAWAEVLQFKFEDTSVTVGTTSYSPAIRSDGGGVYEGGVSGVFAWLADFVANLRTVTSGDGNQIRSLGIDLSSRIEGRPSDCLVEDAFNQAGGPLSICGFNLIPDVMLRIEDKPFSDAVLTRGVTVSVTFNLSPDFSHSAFFLRFPARLKITVDPTNPNARILSGVRADDGTVAVAELVKRDVVKNGRYVDVSLGHFAMPFQVKITR